MAAAVSAAAASTLLRTALISAAMGSFGRRIDRLFRRATDLEVLLERGWVMMVLA